MALFVVLFALVEPAVSAAARAVASVPEPHALPPQAAAQALDFVAAQAPAAIYLCGCLGADPRSDVHGFASQ